MKYLTELKGCPVVEACQKRIGYNDTANVLFLESLIISGKLKNEELMELKSSIVDHLARNA